MAPRAGLPDTETPKIGGPALPPPIDAHCGYLMGYVCIRLFFPLRGASTLCPYRKASLMRVQRLAHDQILFREVAAHTVEHDPRARDEKPQSEVVE
jgi:hypothetical protein